MLEKLYKRLLLLFITYVLILNIICFITALNPKQLLNPFHIKTRTTSVYHMVYYIVAEAGFGIQRTSEKDIQSHVMKMSHKYKVDPKIIQLIIQTESNFNEFAISRTGAMGLMQVMPITFKETKLTLPFNYQQNIEAGTQYFAKQLKRFGRLDLALAAYNAGPQNVIKAGHNVPNFSETKAYVKSISTAYNAIADKEPISPYRIQPENQ